MTANTDDLRIRKTDELISPEQLIADLEVSNTAAQTVANAPQYHPPYSRR